MQVKQTCHFIISLFEALQLLLQWNFCKINWWSVELDFKNLQRTRKKKFKVARLCWWKTHYYFMVTFHNKFLLKWNVLIFKKSTLKILKISKILIFLLFKSLFSWSLRHSSLKLSYNKILDAPLVFHLKRNDGEDGGVHWKENSYNWNNTKKAVLCSGSAGGFTIGFWKAAHYYWLKGRVSHLQQLL